MDMSLQLHQIGPIPEETERSLVQLFEEQTFYLRLRDEWRNL